jgi:hypothetical protein
MDDVHVWSARRNVRVIAMLAIFSCGDDSATGTDAALGSSRDASTADARLNGLEG